MENLYLLALMLGLISCIVGLSLFFAPNGLNNRLQAAICLVLGVNTLAVSQISVAGDFPSFWIMLSNLWPLLPAMGVHLIQEKHGPCSLFSLKQCKICLYVPSFFFISLGILQPESSYLYIAASHEIGLFIPTLGYMLTQLQVLWLIVLDIFLLFYLIGNKTSSSRMFFDVMVWYLPIVFILAARFTTPLGAGNLPEMIWIPIIIPIVAAFNLLLNSKKLRLDNLQHFTSEIMFHTDRKGKILHTNRNTLLQLGNVEGGLTHINHVFPDLRIKEPGRGKRLTYMNRHNQQRVPVRLDVNTMPDNQGFLITGMAI